MSYCFWIDSIFYGHGVQGNHVDSGETNSPSVSGNDDWRKNRHHAKGEIEIMDDIIYPIWGKKESSISSSSQIGRPFWEMGCMRAL